GEAETHERPHLSRLRTRQNDETGAGTPGEANSCGKRSRYRGTVHEGKRGQFWLRVPGASKWLQNATTRSRKPIRETSVPSIESCLNKWLLPDLGALPIADVNNLAVKRLV